MSDWKLETSQIEWNTVEAFRKGWASSPSMPDPCTTALLGWLSPDGLLFPCAYGDHNWLQAVLEKFYGIDDLEAESSGWVGLMYNNHRCTVREGCVR